MVRIYSDDLNEADNLEIAYLLENSSEVEICKAADQGNVAADFIFHSMWDEVKRNSVSAIVDKHRQEQWEI